MSYCRFGEADVYIYDDVYFGIICAGCHLMYDGEMQYSSVLDADLPVLKDFVAGYDRQKMLDHIAEHRYVHDCIPFDVDERLIFERDCKHDFKDNGYCKHCWSSKGR